MQGYDKYQCQAKPEEYVSPYGTAEHGYGIAVQIIVINLKQGLGKKPTEVDNQQIRQGLSENNPIVRKENIVRDGQGNIERQCVKKYIDPP